MRFFAALAVVVTHIELLKSQYLKPNLWKENKLIFELGELGVVFFFVLSGFLITYLLLQEKAATGTVSIRKFYFRRILRIWPLYFLLMLVGFFVLPHFSVFDHTYFTKFFKENFWSDFVLYLFILPNLALAMFKPVPHIGQLWSIGVEEQFYLIWPWLVKKSKNVLPILCMVIILCLGVKFILQLFLFSGGTDEWLINLKTFIATLKFESMAIGGIGAWAVYEKKKLRFLLSNGTLLISILLLLCTVYFTPDAIQDGIFILQSVFFLMIILNVSGNDNSFIRAENKLLVFLGNISYGIYMYHMIVIAAVILIMNKAGIEISNQFIPQLIIYAFSILLTILVSWLSYTYFESYFIRLKKKVTLIKSGTLNE